jgi:hypothetical protein
MAASAPALPADCLVTGLPAGTRITRIHWRSNDPVWFGPAPGVSPGNRFDAPAGEYGTLYAAQELRGSFAETVLRKKARIIAWPLVEKRSWSILELQRDIAVAQLHGEGLAWHGVTAEICTGYEYVESQALSLAFHGVGVDGIAYRGQHNNDVICYALFDRVEAAALKVVETHDFTDDRITADDLVRQHRAVWDPMLPLPDLTKLP